MVDSSNDFINELRDLQVIPKELSPDAVDKLKIAVNNFMVRNDTKDINVILPYMINLVYNASYSRAVEDVIDVFYRKSHEYRNKYPK